MHTITAFSVQSRPLCVNPFQDFSLKQPSCNDTCSNCREKSGPKQLTNSEEVSVELSRCACPKNLAPVCGKNGKTYPNYCVLQCELGEYAVSIFEKNMHSIEGQNFSFRPFAEQLRLLR